MIYFCRNSILVFLFFACTAFSSAPKNTDFILLQDINAGHNPNWDNAMRGLSFSIYPIMPTSVGSTWLNGYLKKDQTMMRNAYKSAIGIGLAMITATGLKLIVDRPRPFVTYANEIVKRDDAGPYSFPSGHTTAAFATATTLSLSYKKWYVAVPAYLYAGFVGYSRMRLGMHYPTDVLAGAVIGAGFGILTWKLDQLIFGK